MANIVEPQSPEFGSQPQSSGSGKGCLWGCLIAGGLFIGSILCAGIGGYWFLNKQITTYTSDKPVVLPTVEYSEEDLAALEARVESFQSKLEEGQSPEQDLVLTAEEINALISKNEDMKGRVFIKLENDQVEGDVSIPLDAIPMCKGRFFNGPASFDVSMDGGVLIVTADQASVNGEPVPEAFMQGLRSENLAKDVYKDPDSAKVMRQFEEIRIEDNKVILRFKRNSSGEIQEVPAENPTSDTEADKPEESAVTDEAAVDL